MSWTGSDLLIDVANMVPKSFSVPYVDHHPAAKWTGVERVAWDFILHLQMRPACVFQNSFCCCRLQLCVRRRSSRAGRRPTSRCAAPVALHTSASPSLWYLLILVSAVHKTSLSDSCGSSSALFLLLMKDKQPALWPRGVGVNFQLIFDFSGTFSELEGFS